MATVRACSIAAKALAAFVAGFALTSAAWAESAAFARATGASMRLDTRQGVRIAAKGASETIAYSPRWACDGGGRGATALPACTVKADGATLKTASEEGEVEWSPDSTGAHALTHTAGDVVYTAQFTVLGDDVAQHAGALAVSETWSSNQVHLVTADVTVPSGKTLTIEPGAVIKFMTGTSLTVNGTCVAYGVIFTHVNDDTAGGDTLMDGDATKPVMDGYKLTGNIYEDDATEERYTAPQTLDSSISGTKRLKGHKVYLANYNVTVNSGATLTLLPGAIIKFASGCSMTVNGTLDAQGTRAAPIVFTSAKDDDWGGDTNGDGEKTYAQAGDWHQVTGSGTVKMNYCQVLWCSAQNNQGALYPNGGTWTFDNSIVAHCQYDCMRSYVGTFNANNSVFMDSSMGAAPSSGTCRFVNCVFYYLTTAVRWGCGSYYNCIFADIAEDIIDTKFYSSTVNSPFGHCCFWAPNATGDKAAAKVGKDGNIYADPKFLDPDNGDFRIAADSPCIDAGDGTVAPEVDYWGQPRMDAKGKKATGVPNADGVCPDIGIYEFPGKATIPVADLAVLSVTAPSVAVPGEEIALTYVVTNRGAAEAVGMVRDQIALKGADAALGGQTVAAGEIQQLYSLAVGAAATLTARVKCPTVKSGNWTVGVTVNAERDIFEQVTANNTGWASETTTVELEGLAVGESRVSVAASTAKGFALGDGVKAVRIASDAALDKIAVYGANGAIPASSEGGVAAVRLGDGSWLLVLPDAAADEKGYVVIENGGVSEVELKMTAEETKLAVLGVAPGRVAAVDGVSVTITGTGLAEGQTVTLGGRTATRIMKVNEAQIVATFDLKGMAAGAAEVAVDGGADGVRALPVEVYKTTKGPKLEAKLELPSSVRDGRIYTAYVVYANVGDEPMTAPIFTVKRTDSATKLKILMSDDFTTGPLHIVGIGSGYPAGVLAAGDSGRIPFYFMPNGTYRLELSHAKDETAATAYKQFADTADYRQAVADAATRLSARGKAEYRVRECVNFALAERAERDVAAISGRVLDATTREPLSGVTVSAVMTNDTTRTASCTADVDGLFALGMLADGDWQLSVDGGVVSGSDVVTVTDQKDVNGHVLAANLLATISGTVLTADTHEPIEGAAVRLCLNNGELPSDETMTDASGTFKFNGAVSGTYALVVNSKDGYVGDVVTNVVLSLGSSYAAGVFELSKGAILSGTVTQDGDIVTNGMVYAYFADGSAARATCSTNGTYCFDGLPPYGYRVRYSGDGVQADFVDVTLGAGETKELDLVAKSTPLFFPIRPRGYGSLTTQFMVADPVLATNATAFAWDFDNDGSVDSTDEEPEWTYDAVGSYSVKLVVTTPQDTKTSLYENCVTVEEAIENVFNANAFRVDETSGIDCTALGENTLTLVGTPPRTLAAGVVVGGKFGDEWYIRRITGVTQSGTTYTLTTEEATLDDLYASYCFTACAPVEVVKPVQNLKKAGPRLMAANAEGDDKLVRVYAEGGATLTPSVGWSGAYVLYDNAKPINGVPYTRIGIGGKLYFSLSGEIYVQGGVKLNPEFSFPVTLPTTIPFVDAKAELIFGDYLGVEGKVSGGFEVWCNPRICMGIERWGTGSWQLLKPFDFSDRGSETHWNEVSGSIKGGAYVQIKAGLVAAKLFEVTVGPKVELSESLTSTLKGSTAWDASLGLSGVVEAGVKTENVPIVGKFLSFMDVGASLEIGMINVKLQQIKSPEPDFTASPDQGDAPLAVTLTDQSKEEYFYHIGMGDFTRRPKIYEWNLGDGSHRTWGKDDKYGSLLHRYEKEGVYEVSLKVKGHSLTGNRIATRKVSVGKEKPPEDEQQKDGQGGGTPAKSCDPNEMAGPLGAGDPETERFVKPGEWMDYTIYFENKADADVPAQEVFVDAQLSEYLDWSTFEMGEVAFNNQNETVLAGLRNGEPKLVAQNGADYKVQLSVTFDEKTGAAHWYFRSYDPSQSEYNYWPAAVDAGFLPPNDETHRGEGHITYRVKVRDDAPTGVKIDAAATIVFDQNEPIPTDPAWWNTVGSALAEGTSGQYVSYDLVEDLGVEIPEDVDYAAGDKVTVKVEGLAKGLKVVATPVYEDPNAKKKVIVGYKYTIEGVPTETVDFDTQTMYARVSVTYKDKTKTADGSGKVESLQPVGLSIVSQEPHVLTAGVLNEVYEPIDIAELWPDVADAKVNPKDWSFKGWPAGIKYNATAKDASWSFKYSDGKSEKAISVPYTVYGQPTKAGEFPITATHKYKVGKTTVSETFSAVLTVWGDDGATDFRYTDQAYVATETKTLGATFKSFSGLPTGVKWTTKPVAADAKKGTPEYPAYSLYGTPTKAGVFAVTATKADPDDPAGKKTVKETFLWKVAPATAPTFALDPGTAPIEDRKTQVVQGANLTFAITASEGAKVTASGLPTGLKLVQDKTTKLYSVQGVATKPGEYVVTFKTVLNGVTTTSVVAFTVKGNPFEGTYYSYSVARPADGAAYRLAVAEVTVAAAGTVKLTYTEGKTKYTASVKSFDWDDETGKGTAEDLVLKASSADKKLGYGDRKATVTFEDCGAYRLAKLASITDANGAGLSYGTPYLYSTVTTTEVPLPASRTYVFRTEDGGPLAAVSVAYDAKKATAAFSGKLYDGTAVKATVPVMRWDDMGTDEDYGFASFQVIAKDGETFVFDCPCEGAGYIYRISEDGEERGAVEATSVSYAYSDALFAALVPEAGAFTFGWDSDAEVVGASTESFAFEVTTDKNGNPAGVAIYDADPQEGEKALATVTAKMGKTTGAISVSFTSKKGDKAKYEVELVWQGEKLFAGHVTRIWKGPDPVTGKPVNKTAFGTAEVK
ncbi:MAG: carboxypeptidase regulatory-like domain-containing protein [bacterium]|nr:carboxypeptidase regulatory-like domain-containing protein [bacterium]